MDYQMLCGAKGVPGSISTWTNNSRIQADLPEIVLEAESWIWRRLRHWRMLTPPVTGTLLATNDYLPLPADMLEPFIFCLTGVNQQTLRMRTPQEVVAAWAFDGSGNRVPQQPMIYYFDQANFRFDSPSDQPYPYALIYFQQPQPLAITTSNFLTVTYPRLLRLACMAAACEWLKDFGQGGADRSYYDALAQDEIDKAQAESDRARRATETGAVIIGGGDGGMLRQW